MYYNYAFKNAAEFQQLFKKEHGTRHNKILLSFLKCKEIRRSYPQYLDISSMHELINVCMGHLVKGYYDATIKLGIFDLAHPDYRTDERMGFFVAKERHAIVIRFNLFCVISSISFSRIL